MKLAALALVGALGVAGTATAQDHYVQGYTRSNGTYVAPHYAANPGSSYGSGYSAPTTTSGYGGNHQVNGYATSSGTYVSPYMATNPNATRQDNYSTQGNVNPYTGQPGKKAPW